MYWAWANRMPKIGSNTLIYLSRHTTRRQWHTHLESGKKCKLQVASCTLQVASCQLPVDVWAKMAKRRSRSKRAKNASVLDFSVACGVCQEGLLPTPLNSTHTVHVSVSVPRDWPTFGRSAPQVGGYVENQQPPHKQKPATNILRRHPYASSLHLSMPSSHAEFSLFFFCVDVEVEEEYMAPRDLRSAAESRATLSYTPTHGSLTRTLNLLHKKKAARRNTKKKKKYN